MEKSLWFKYPQNLSNDKRVLALLNAEGGKGFGLYMYLIECLSKQPDGKLSFENLNCIKLKGLGRECMERVIRKYELFNIQGDEFSSTIPFFSSTTGGVVDGHSTTTGGVVGKYSTTTGEAEHKNESKKIEDNTLKNNEKHNEKGEISPLARVREDKNREEENREDKTSKEEKEEADTNSPEAGSAGGGRPPATPVGTTPATSDNSDDDRPQGSRLPFRPWQELVDELTVSSSWLDIACMKSGYGLLLMKHIKKAVEVFKEHIIAYDKGGGLQQMSDVHNYFMNFVRYGQPTSRMLQKTLQDFDQEQTAAGLLPPAPDCYERIIDGRRTYWGCPIPDYAPPRPGKDAIWNDQTRLWIDKKDRKRDKR